jgi:hypothetical protein
VLPSFFFARPLTPEEGEAEESSNPPPDDIETRLVSCIGIIVDRGVCASVFMNEYTKYLLTSFPGVEYELQDKNL